jgi:hypothetical protein
MYVNVTLRRIRITIFAVVKQQVLHILSVTVALGIQHAMRRRRIIQGVSKCNPGLQKFIIGKP